MQNTNTKAFRQKVYAYLLDCADGLTPAEIWDRFNVEYNYPANKVRHPNLQSRVAEWLSGLALMTEYTYYDIIARCEDWHECTLTQRERDMVCERWFQFLAQKLLQLWAAHKVEVSL